MDKPRSYPLPDFGDLIFLLLIYFLLFTVPDLQFGDGSIGWHLVTGHFIADTHSIPHRDIISYTFPNAPWVAYEWLFDLMAASIEKLAGLNGLAVIAGSTTALVILLLYEKCRRRGMNFLLAAFLIIVATLASSVHFLARPHVFTMLAVYIFSTTLEAFHRGEISKTRLVATFSVCMVLWVNLHPAFLFGFALTIIYLVCELAAGLSTSPDTARGAILDKAKWYTIALGSIFICSLANPYGAQLYSYIAHFLQVNQSLQVLVEYESPVFHGALQPTCLEIIFLCLALSLAFTRKRPSFPQLMACLAFAHLSLTSVRHVPEFAVVALPFIADLSSQLRSPFKTDEGNAESPSWWLWISERMRTFNQGFDQNEAACQMHILPAAAVIILFAISVNSGDLGGQKILNSGFSKAKLPSAALDYIRDNKLPPQSGFNYDNWGGFIRYRLGIPVFIDDRLDFYGRDFFLDYVKIVRLAQGWRDLLDSHKVNWIIYPKNSPLAGQLKLDPTWELVCEDEAAYLFVRKQK